MRVFVAEWTGKLGIVILIGLAAVAPAYAAGPALAATVSQSAPSALKILWPREATLGRFRFNVEPTSTTRRFHEINDRREQPAV